MMRIFQKVSILIVMLFSGLGASLAADGNRHLEAYRNYIKR